MRDLIYISRKVYGPNIETAKKRALRKAKADHGDNVNVEYVTWYSSYYIFKVVAK